MTILHFLYITVNDVRFCQTEGRDLCLIASFMLKIIFCSKNNNIVNIFVRKINVKVANFNVSQCC